MTETTTTGHDMTETGTLTLAGFLLARIAEDEALLKAWRGLPDYLQGRGDWQIREWESDESGGMSIPEARLAAECEAKRRIIDVAVEDLLPNTLFGEATDDYGWAILYALALPYADHPDYREEWRP